MTTTTLFSPDMLAAIGTLCVRHKVKALYLFGSALTDRFTPESDIDLLVCFAPDIDLLDYADNYFDLMYELRALFGRSVDLVTESSLSNPYFIASVNNTKQLIYAA